VTDAAGGPRVSDEQVSVEAGRITVQIASRDMSATGSAKTILRPKPAAPGPPRATGAAAAGSSRLPGLFEQGSAANGNADGFEYSGSGGQATYSGNATLWQGDTAVRGNRIAIDQRTGDLRVTGAARSTLKLATGTSDGRGAALSYVDRTRTIVYEGDATGQAQVVGPDGDLRADRVTVVLEAGSNRVDELQAATAVTLKLDSRTATGAQLTYRAADEQYVMKGSGRSVVKIVEKCRETTGSTLTFYKSADRIIIDGSEAARTQSVRGQQCSEPRRP
jgi:lipopolysaccharide export system protein LptA